MGDTSKNETIKTAEEYAAVCFKCAGGVPPTQSAVAMAIRFAQRQSKEFWLEAAAHILEKEATGVDTVSVTLLFAAAKCQALKTKESKT